MKTKQIVIKPPLETSIAGLAFAMATMIGIGPLSAAGPLVYEPFNYGPGKLQLVSSWSKVTGGDFVVQATGLDYGTLPISGAHIKSDTATSGDRGYTLNSAAATIGGAGLLADGQTLWMSAVIQAVTAANASIVVRLGTDYVNGTYAITGGTGDSVGFNVQNGNDLQTRYHVGGIAGPNGAITTNLPNISTTLLVMEMIWNADNTQADTIKYYRPDTDLNLGSPVLTINAAIFNQAAFDTFSVSGSNASVLLDEIRFGASYDDVISPIVGTDTTPPAPDPMTFAVVPTAAGQFSVTMTAAIASDASGVQYRFLETTGSSGATSSVWQDSRTYVDAGLAANTTYTYNVQARDKSAANNTNTVSADLSATTDDQDYNAPQPNPMTFAVPPRRTGDSTSLTMTATTATDESGIQYLFENLTSVTDSGWQGSPAWTETGLAPGTSYTYQVTARDTSPNGNTTSPSAAAAATTEIALAGDELIATLFVNRTVSGTTASNITYLLNGINDPGALTVAGAGAFFNTGDAQGFFAPVDNPASWSVNMPLTIGGGGLILGDVVVDFRSFDAGGGLKISSDAAKVHDAEVELFDGSMASLGSQTISAPAGSLQIWTGTFDSLSGTTLAASGTYTLRVSILNAPSGNNVGIDNIRITPGTPGTTFATWIGGFGLDPGDQSFNFDADGDGSGNGVEAWFGTNPATGNPGLSEVAKSGNTVTFTHPVADPALGDVTGSYEWSLGLGTWNASTASQSGVTVGIDAAAPVLGITTVTATITGTVPDKLLVRAVATQN